MIYGTDAGRQALGGKQRIWVRIVTIGMIHEMHGNLT